MEIFTYQHRTFRVINFYDKAKAPALVTLLQVKRTGWERLGYTAMSCLFFPIAINLAMSDDFRDSFLWRTLTVEVVPAEFLVAEAKAGRSRTSVLLADLNLAMTRGEALV